MKSPPHPATAAPAVTPWTLRWLLLPLIVGLVAGCSPKRMAVDMIGSALAGGGGVYNSDEDPDLVYEALPFGLKTFESLLAGSPENEDILLASARGFGAYAYLMSDRAERIDEDDVVQARQLRARAGKLYLRGRDYALQGLELRYPGWGEILHSDRDAALTMTGPEDAPFLYWGGVTWAGAVGSLKDDMGLIAELPLAAAMVARVLELDETFDEGAAHEFFVTYEGSRPGGSRDQTRAHYARALEFSGGVKGSVHLALAETVAVQEQDLAEFRRLLDATLAIDPDAVPRHRLINTVAQRRARWLLERLPDLFLEAESAEDSQ